ncbi:hypothetical protein, partial [Marinomonas gallaica]
LKQVNNLLVKNKTTQLMLSLKKLKTTKNKPTA